MKLISSSSQISGNFPENGCILVLKGFPGGRGYEAERVRRGCPPPLTLWYLSHLEKPFPSLSQTMTRHFQACSALVSLNPGRPHPNRNRLGCQGHPSRRVDAKQSPLKSAKAFFQQYRLERALGSLASPGSLASGLSAPRARSRSTLVPGSPFTHPAQGAPGVPPLPGPLLKLKHGGRCGPPCPPRSGNGQEVLWAARQPAPWRPASVQFLRLSGQGQGSYGSSRHVPHPA